MLFTAGIIASHITIHFTIYVKVDETRVSITESEAQFYKVVRPFQQDSLLHDFRWKLFFKNERCLRIKGSLPCLVCCQHILCQWENTGLKDEYFHSKRAGRNQDQTTFAPKAPELISHKLCLNCFEETPDLDHTSRDKGLRGSWNISLAVWKM